MADVSARLAKARQHAEAGRLEQARAEAAAAVQKAPRDPAANATMSRILSMMGRTDPAITFARAALAAAPGHPQLLADLGTLLMDTDAAEAESLLARGAEADPKSLPAAHNLASVLLKRHRYAAALAACDRGLALRPGWDELIAKRTFALQSLGRSDEALAELEAAAAAQPKSLTLAQALAVGMQYAADDPARALEAHTRAAALLAEKRGVRELPARPLPADGAPIRVGLVSGDFRRHSVASFARPIIERLDRSRFPLTCYFTASKGDGTTKELKSAAPAWRDVAGMSDADLAAQIRKDGIDVLIELSGLTRGERLGALLARPAPVQATYLGYPNTTGLGAIDFRIVDSTTDPAPEADGWAVERLIRLDPCFLCFRPPAEATPVAERGEGPIVFGSFNAPTKIGPRAMRLWARVLDAAPGSRLLVKNAALDEPEGRAAWAERFEAMGIARERLDLRGFAESLGDHLKVYDEVDIALDTFPYAGTTTTCEAMLMGVPVVTLPGRSHASRVGASLLGAVGLGELVAGDEEAFVRIAAGLAQDRARLAGLRQSLRARLLGSALCDEAGFVRRFEGAIARMVRERAAGAGA